MGRQYDQFCATFLGKEEMIAPQEVGLDQWTVLVPWGWTGCFLVLAHFVWSCAKIHRRNEFSVGNEVKITSCHGVVATLKEVGMPTPYLF